MIVLLVTILIIIWLISCAFSIWVGYYFARKKTVPKPKREILPLTDEQIRAQERSEKEIKNFYDYDGTEQKE